LQELQTKKASEARDA